MNEQAVFALSAILLIGIGCQWIAWRLQLPAILFLLLSGILAGPVMGWLHPDKLFGNLLFPFVSLAVAVILFEGSLTLKFQDIPGLGKVIRNMITFGVVITWLITAFTTRLLLQFSWGLSFLFGAIMVVTGPTVIAPIIRIVRPTENVAHILRWEGILIDPIGAILAIIVYEFIVAGEGHASVTAGIITFGNILAIGSLFGVTGGYLFGYVLRRQWIPQYLHNYAALALICGIFALSNALVAESGLLSVTVMGIWLANMKGIELNEILNFKENLRVVFISILFIILAARINLGTIIALGWPALVLFAVIQFLARPLNAHVSALGSKLSMAERHLLAWIAPRGVVAAAISALFAIKLETIGYKQVSQMVPLSFMVIIGTVLLQSATAKPIAKWLNVVKPEPEGILVIGANAVSRVIAKSLQNNGADVMLVDQNWDHVTAAKMEGVPVFWGHPISQHTDDNLVLAGIGRLVALTPNRELNALAMKHYRIEFGANNIYTVRNLYPENRFVKAKSIYKHGGRHLFDETISYEKLAKFLNEGAEIKTTSLTDQFSYEQYLSQGANNRIPLFAIDPGGHIHLFTSESSFSPKAGWKIIGLSVDGPLR